MFAFPADFPTADCKILVNSARSDEQVAKEELLRAAWSVQGYVLSQLCGVPTLTIGKQAKTDPIAALELAIERAESLEPVAQSNIPWATVLLWILDLVRLALKDRLNA
jgi:hypothetical protein